jgi:hypothetical protein
MKQSLDTMTYQIRVKGQLDPKFSGWFGDFTISHTPDGDSLLTGNLIDQAALYGILERCRDLGLTLISINPLKGENTMNTIQADASLVIDARPEELYAIVSDYRVGHQAIVPRPPFTELTVEEGGQGAGTLVMTRAKIFGQLVSYHQRVTEPEPGRKIVETDIDTGQFSSFTFEPLNDGEQTRVTIAVSYPVSPGIKGVLERLMNPPISRRMFKQELQNLAEYAQTQRANAKLS